MCKHADFGMIFPTTLVNLEASPTFKLGWGRSQHHLFKSITKVVDRPWQIKRVWHGSVRPLLLECVGSGFGSNTLSLMRKHAAQPLPFNLICFFQNNCESAMEKSHDTTFSDLKRLWEGTIWTYEKKNGWNDQKILTSKRAHSAVAFAGGQFIATFRTGCRGGGGKKPGWWNNSTYFGLKLTLYTCSCHIFCNSMYD